MTTEHPNAADWRNRAERAESQCEDLLKQIEHLRAILPSAAGSQNLPDSKVIAFYITLGELRALKQLSGPALVRQALPQDVINLVIAAREVWELVEFGALPDADQTKALDQALEAFSSRVPYADEPVQLPTGDPDHTDCDGPNGGGRFSHPALTPAPAAPTLDGES